MSAKPLLLLAAAAACGSAHHTQDASFVAPGDSFTPATSDAPVGSVVVHVTSGGMPMAGVGVYFQMTDSTLVAALATDDHGTAGALVPDGGFATVLVPPDASGHASLYTFAGVRPSDALELRLSPVGSATSYDVMLTVPSSNASSYAVYTPCGSVNVGASATGEVQLPGCSDPTDMLAVAYDSDGNPASALYQPNTEIACPPSDASACTAQVQGSYTGLVSTSFTYTNVPPTFAYVSTDQELRGPHGRLFDASAGAAPAGGMASSSVMQPADTSGHALGALTVTDATPVATGHGEQLIFDWGTYASQYSLSLQSALLPAYQTDPTYSTDTHSITWMEDGAANGIEPDFSRAVVHASREGIPSATAWTWAIVGPRSATAQPALVYPTLPAGSFDYNPKQGDSVSVSDTTTFHITAADAYGTVRGHAFAPVPEIVELAPQGKTVVQLSYTPPL